LKRCQNRGILGEGQENAAVFSGPMGEKKRGINPKVEGRPARNDHGCFSGAGQGTVVDEDGRERQPILAQAELLSRSGFTGARKR